MRRENKSGSITKLSGNRRKPWRARKTFVCDGKQRFIDIGCFKTKEEAEIALHSEWGSNIYFISDGEFIKIGKSNNVNRRLRELQTANPRELKLLKVIECKNETAAFELEVFLHKILQSTHQNGEWYYLPICKGGEV